MSKRYSIVDKLIETFGDWRRRRRDIREIRDLDRTESAKIARELNIQPRDLDTLVRQGPHAADELPDLLALLGIDRGLLAKTQPLVLRDMTRVCTTCQQKHRCNRDLAAGTSAQHYAEYCLSASTIDDLKNEVRSKAQVSSWRSRADYLTGFPPLNARSRRIGRY
jgi:hypothetical protein